MDAAQQRRMDILMRASLALLVLLTGCRQALDLDGYGVRKEGGSPDGPMVPTFVDGGTDPPSPGPGGNTTAMPCGAATCVLPLHQCCIGGYSMTPPFFTFACVTGDQCPMLADDTIAGLHCSGNANCAQGTVCCIRTPAMKTAFARCQMSCGAGEAQLCDAKAGDTCITGTCKSDNISKWGLPPSYGVCE